MLRAIVVSAALGTLAMGLAGTFGSNVDPAHKFCWAENVGWLNWRRDVPGTGDGVVVTATYLEGPVWAENVGWINVGNGPPAHGVHYANDPADSSTFGVNVDRATGELFGRAWGENIGWISFDTRATQGPHNQQGRLDICANRLRGYAWGENIGWINLDDTVHFMALGPDCHGGDVACDGVITLADYSKFPAAITGPEGAATCPLLDADGDADVDLGDFAEVQIEFSGE